MPASPPDVGCAPVAAELPQLQAALDGLKALLKKPGRGFYLPPEGLRSDRFVAGARLLMSPDGRSARMLAVWNINPYFDEALNTASRIPEVAHTAAAGTPLERAEFTGSGLASISAQLRTQALRDFALFGLVAVVGVFLVLTVLLRSLVAPAIMVAPVILSFGAAAGVSVLLWQHLIGVTPIADLTAA